MFGFLDAAVYFVTQAVIQCPSWRNLPGILKIEVVGFASDGSLVELVTLRGDAGRGGDGVGIRRGGQEARERVGKWVAGLNVVQATCRCDRNWGKRGAPSEAVNAAGIGAKNGGVLIQADFQAPFEAMGAVDVDHVLLDLVDVPVGTKN